MKFFSDDYTNDLVITLQQYNDTLKRMLRAQREVNTILKDENHRLKAELNVKPDNKKCVWKETNTDAWKTACGHTTPRPVGLYKQYCPFCDREIEEVLL